MQKLVRCLLFLVLFINCSALVYAQEPPPVADYDPKAWREFVSPEGRFSVLLPGVPTKKVEQTDVPGGRIGTHRFTLRISNQSPQYNLMYFDVPEDVDIENARVVFDNMRDEGGQGKAVGGEGRRLRRIHRTVLSCFTK
ncbi:MAG: hypothetical protein ACRD9R_13585 [Pyrinomonadaceae bacterium]